MYCFFFKKIYIFCFGLSLFVLSKDECKFFLPHLKFLRSNVVTWYCILGGGVCGGVGGGGGGGEV